MIRIPSTVADDFDSVDRWVNLSVVQFGYKWGKRVWQAITEFNSHALVYLQADRDVAQSLVGSIYEGTKLVTEQDIQILSIVALFNDSDVPEGVEQVSTAMGVTEDEVPGLWFIFR